MATVVQKQFYNRDDSLKSTKVCFISGHDDNRFGFLLDNWDDS